MIDHHEFIKFAQGRTDAMGQPFSSWAVARYHDDGRAMRDAAGHQVFESQADCLAREGHHHQRPAGKAAAAQQELFA
jgi:hypothetical protein